jgi:outer membrane protein
LKYCFFVLLFCSVCSFAWAKEELVPSPTLSLNDCIKIAISVSKELDLITLEEKEKSLAVSVSKKNLYPSFGLQHSYTNQPSSMFSKANYYSAQLSVQQSLYKGKALVTGIIINKLELEKTQLSYEQTLQQLRYSIIDAYFNLLRANNLKLEAKQAVTRLERHLEDARSFFEVGLIPENDLLASEVQLAQGQQNLFASENNARLSETILNLKLNREIDQPINIKDNQDNEPEQIEWEIIIKKAFDNRISIKQGKITIEQAEHNLTIIKSAYLPSINIGTIYQKQGDDLLMNSYSLGPSEQTILKLTVSWRFWSWKQDQDKSAIAEKQIAMAKLHLARIKDAVIIEVRKAYLDVLQAQQNISVTRKTIKQAQENFRINQDRYQEQLTTSTAVLDAQTLLTSARTNHFSAIYDYQISKARLKLAIGVK